MPNPHFRVQVISRGGGRSAVAAAAYRSGEVLTASPSVVGMASYRAGEYLGDATRGETFDYTRKEGVEWSAIFAPKNAPEWVRDRERLWNEVEQAEVRKDARLAREIEASLPREASPEQWREMVGELAGHFTRHGLVVDVSIHNVKARDGGDNPHAHFLIADRPVDERGFRGSKTSVRFLNSDLALKGWRQGWEDITNRALEAAGREERLSLQSYRERGIDREPTRPLGPKASALEKQGIKTPEGDRNRRIQAENALREERRRLDELEGGDARRPSGRQAEASPDATGRTGEWWESYYRRIDAIKKHQESVARGEEPQAYERNPANWSEFSANVGAEVNAARDAVHRFRQKDAAKEEDMSDSKDPEREAHLRAMVESLQPEARQALDRVRQDTQAQGIRQVSEQAYNYVPDARQQSPGMERALGLSKEGTMPPTPSPEAQAHYSAAAAGMRQGQEANGDAVNLQQKQFTLTTARQEKETSIAHQYGAPKEQDIGMATEKLKQEQKDKGRDGR